MVAELLAGAPELREFAELLRHGALPDGTTPEERMVICGISWERYLALDRALGDDCPGPRLYYLDQELEIMTTSNEHERITEWMGIFMDIYFESIGVEVTHRGQATMRDALKAAGAEPDKSWCIGDEKEWPDLVLEIALTSGGVRKLEVYRRFAVPEVWFWRKGALEVFVLEGETYGASTTSRLLPDLDLKLLGECLRIASWQEARRSFRAGVAEK